jgi:hypothetical protein
MASFKLCELFSSGLCFPLKQTIEYDFLARTCFLRRTGLSQAFLEITKHIVIFRTYLVFTQAKRAELASLFHIDLAKYSTPIQVDHTYSHKYSG